MKKFDVFWEVSHHIVLEAEDEEAIRNILENNKMIGTEKEIILEPEIEEIKND